MVTLRIYSNRHIKHQVRDVQKGDWIYLENSLSRKRWSLYFRVAGIDESELKLTYIDFEEFMALEKKFKNIVGNPPYVDASGGNIPLYNKFVEKCHELSDRVSLIIPSSCAISDERHGNVVRRAIFNEHTQEIRFLPKETFENADVSTLEYHVDMSKCNKKITVINESGQSYQANSSDVYIWKDPILRSILEKCGSIANTRSWVVFNRLEKDMDDGICKKVVTCINKDNITFENSTETCQYINNHKIVTSFLPNSQSHLDVVWPVEKGIAVKKGYTVCVVDSYKEAENLAGFLSSNLCRCIHNKTKTSRSLRTPQLKFIPKIDLSQTWTDQDLYDHFGFSKKEIDYIEKHC